MDNSIVKKWRYETRNGYLYAYYNNVLVSVVRL